jgi:hypothetical protein
MKRSSGINDELSSFRGSRCCAAFVLPVREESLKRDVWTSAHLNQRCVLPKSLFSGMHLTKSYHLRRRIVDLFSSNSSRFAVLRSWFLLLLCCNLPQPCWESNVHSDMIIIFSYRRRDPRRSCTRCFIYSVAAAALSGCGAR